MKTMKVYFTKRFPSSSHPIYCECRENSQVIYWNAFESLERMQSFMEKLYYDYKVVFQSMDKKH